MARSNSFPIESHKDNRLWTIVILFVLAVSLLLPPKALATYWSDTSPLYPWGPENHTATLLPNGKVLVAGGSDGFGVLKNANLYDLGTGTWMPTGFLNARRYRHTATLLPNGKVLVAGGGMSVEP